MPTHRLVLLPWLALAWVLAVGGAPAGADLRLDRSFGEQGVVQVEPEAPGRYAGLGAMAAAPDGGAFVLETASPDCAGCLTWFLTRYRPDGQRDRDFGLIPLFTLRYTYPLLTVDSRGRPMLAWADRGKLTVRRYLRTGRPDPAFGRRGRIVIGCGCDLEDLALAPGRRFVLVGAARERSKNFKGTVPFFARVREDGTLDRSFNGDGIARPRLPGVLGVSGGEVDRGGALIFSGSVCCEAEDLPYLGRLTAKGRVDRRFSATAKEAVRRLRPWIDEYLWWRTDLMLRPDGRLIILTNIEGKGTILQLHRDGRLDRGFGQNGGRRLPWQVSDGAPVGGGITVIAETRSRGNVAFELGPAGRLDRAGAVDLPRSYAIESLAAEAIPGGRVMVFDYDSHECRGSCPSHPRMYRLKVKSNPGARRRSR